MRLIDRDRLIDILTDATGFAGNCEGCTDIGCVDCIIDDVIEIAPTIEAEPVRHGKWNDDFGELPSHAPYGWECSYCGDIAFNKHNYCPNCGAKMDGGDNE